MDKEDLKDFQQAGMRAGEAYSIFDEGFSESVTNSLGEGEHINPKAVQSIREIVKETFLMHYQEWIDNGVGFMDETVLIDAPPTVRESKCDDCQCNECDNWEDCVGGIMSPSTGKVEEMHFNPCAECNKAGRDYAPLSKSGKRCPRFEPRRI